MIVEASQLKQTKMVDVSKSEALNYYENLKKFQQIFEEEKQSFHDSRESIYYIVSTKFLREWKQFCRSDQPKRAALEAMNADIVEGGKLKIGLVEKDDFQILGKRAFTILKPFANNIMERHAFYINSQKKVPIYQQSYKYIPLTIKKIKQIENNNLKKSQLKAKQVQYSEQATIEDLIKVICQIQNINYQEYLRLWKIQGTKLESVTEIIYNHIKKEVRGYWQYTIKGLGNRLSAEMRLEDLEIKSQDIFIAEIASGYYQNFFLKAQKDGKCEYCNKIKELNFVCGCKKVAYCSYKCQQNDAGYHSRFCNQAQKEMLNRKIPMKMSNFSRRGRVGLSNLGNTCFMNSCLQCLSNTIPLTNYFLGQHYESEINLDNPIGTKGKLIKSYAKFIKAMWCDDNHVFSPSDIKNAVSRLNPMFSGYQQHDSQEFFSFIVDGIHEDLNRIKKKPYVESIDSNDRLDEIVATQSWINYQKRNQSIITDLMTGQYRSKVTCPDCGKESITFDPFITVTLPIPESRHNILQFYAFSPNMVQHTKKLSIRYKKANTEEWKAKAGEAMKLAVNTFKMYVVSAHDTIYDIEQHSAKEMVYQIQTNRKYVFLIELSSQELVYKKRITIPVQFSKKNYYDNDHNLWLKYPFFFEEDNLAGRTVAIKALLFLYQQAYQGPKKHKQQKQYLEDMLVDLPFTMILVMGRNERTSKEIPIDLSDNLQEVVRDRRFKLQQCEIKYRFSDSKLNIFKIENLRNHKSWGQQIKSDSFDNVEVPLGACFELLNQPEELEKGNEWYCPQCKQHKRATKQLEVYKAPKVLILHLKRFKQKGIIRREKNDSKIIFPMMLNMEDFLIDPRPMSSYVSELKAHNVYINPSFLLPDAHSQQPHYDLFAVSNHYGGMGGGHYTAYAKNGEKWFDFNDSSVRETGASSIVGSGAYMLFYQRKDV